ncbi:MAG: DNA gyrase C-terminal beta-propeller domain-containing protein, partial [Aristaeellaceae bacterium]
ETPVPEEAFVAYTYGGQLKRMLPAMLRRNPLPTYEEDSREAAQYLFLTKTDETLLIFTDHGNCYPLSVGALNECKPKERGQLLPGVLQGLEDGEQPLYMTCVKLTELGKMADLLFVTRQGMVKRTAARDYEVRSRKFAAVNIKKDDQLLAVFPADTREDLLMVSRRGMSIRFTLDSVPTQGRISAGVKAMQLEAGDEVIWCAQLPADGELVLFSDRGYGKRIPAMDFERQNRNGKGVRVFTFNKNGSNGRQIAGLFLADKEPCTIIVTQVQSPATRLDKDSIVVQSKTDRGTPYVMAILEDVVTGIMGEAQVESPA